MGVMEFDAGMSDPRMSDPGMSDPGMSDPGMSDPGMPPAPVEEGRGRDVLALIRAALDGLDEYKATEDDEENTLLAEQATSLLQKILANEQRAGNNALAGRMSPQMLGRAYGA